MIYRTKQLKLIRYKTGLNTPYSLNTATRHTQPLCVSALASTVRPRRPIRTFTNVLNFCKNKLKINYAGGITFREYSVYYIIKLFKRHQY